MEESRSKRRELESKILEKVGEVVSAIKQAKYVDQVICALHSIAVHLFPVDSSRLSGCVDSRFRNQLLSDGISSPSERDEWWHVFYHGAAFPTLARVLIYNVALDWLACFPLSARTHVYDSFFIKGPPTEVVQAIIPGLMKNGSNKDTDLNAVCSNVERILVLFLLDNNGMLQMAREFGGSCSSEEFTNELLKPDMLAFISRIAQLVASIPDKARWGAPAALSSEYHSQFFKQVIIQLLAGAEERSVEICNKGEALDQSVSDGTFLFVGETFSRICRRGFADILLAEVIPRILGHVRGCLSSCVDFIDDNLFKSKTNFQFWFKMMETIKDSYAVERLSEQLLRQLATEHVTDIEAYWTLWILFRQTFRKQTSIRSIFVEKCILWKVFPVCCLRWILQFAVLDCPPSSHSLTKGQNTQGLIDIVQRLVGVWSKRQFVQSATMEQQAYVTAAVGLTLEQMSKEELETTKDVMPLILQGVSCRLESPVPLVRRMASCIALVFSKVVDPKNPLYLDDSCSGDTIDWEFGFNRQPKQIPASSDRIEKADDEVKNFVSQLNKGVSSAADDRKNSNVKGRHKKLSELKLVDPDEIVDPATLNNEYSSDEYKEEDDDDSENSESLSDSSLQPYDLSDDDADLKKKISQLVDLFGALRKPDDPDSVERALDVAGKLVRASPDELQHVSGDLVRTLVQLRCSDLTIEGEEDSAEGKRQRALVALLVICPFESVAAVNKLLYSPNVDISQRILMLDVMTDAAQELADATSNRPRYQQRNLISTSEQPWFLPQSKGPHGASPWKEVSETGTSLSWSYRYERDLPLKPSQIKTGKSRRWSLRSEKMQENQLEYSKNKFPLYAAAFMFPAMQGFDKKRHGVDLLGGDFIVLGKLIYMLGVCMKCVAMHPEAMALAPALLDMLSSSVQNFKAAMSVPAALGLDPAVANSVHWIINSGVGSILPSGVQSAILDGIFAAGRAQLSDYLLNDKNPFGSFRLAKLRSILEEGKSLQLQFPAEDLGFRYLEGALVPEKDELLDASEAPTGRRRDYVPSAEPGSRLPHINVRMLPKLSSEEIFSTLDLVSRDKVEFVLIIAPKNESYSLAQAALKVADEFRISLNVCVMWPHGTIKEIDADKAALMSNKNCIHVEEIKRSAASPSWWEICQMTDRGAILVRPDEHIAWRTMSEVSDPTSEMEKVFSFVLLGKKTFVAGNRSKA